MNYKRGGGLWSNRGVTMANNRRVERVQHSEFETLVEKQASSSAQFSSIEPRRG